MSILKIKFYIIEYNINKLIYLENSFHCFQYHNFIEFDKHNFITAIGGLCGLVGPRDLCAVLYAVHVVTDSIQ